MWAGVEWVRRGRKRRWLDNQNCLLSSNSWMVRACRVVFPVLVELWMLLPFLLGRRCQLWQWEKCLLPVVGRRNASHILSPMFQIGKRGGTGNLTCISNEHCFLELQGLSPSPDAIGLRFIFVCWGTVFGPVFVPGSILYY